MDHAAIEVRLCFSSREIDAFSKVEALVEIDQGLFWLGMPDFPSELAQKAHLMRIRIGCRYEISKAIQIRSEQGIPKKHKAKEGCE